MREAIGGSALLSLVITFVSLIILFFIGILSYTKAYRVKNTILDIIERNGGYSETAIEEINSYLSGAGYNTSLPTRCSKGNLNTYGYNYCVYEMKNKTTSYGDGDNPTYYKVESFIHFDVPVIGDAINIKVSGETKILGRNYNY